MDVADKTRLAKLLGMLGSKFDGERANAAAMIQKMADKYKITITELMAQAHGAPQQAKPQPQYNPYANQQTPYGQQQSAYQQQQNAYRAQSEAAARAQQEMLRRQQEAFRQQMERARRAAAEAARAAQEKKPKLFPSDLIDALAAVDEDVLTEWEVTFRDSICRRNKFDHQLSDKQRAVVERILGEHS